MLPFPNKYKPNPKVPIISNALAKDIRTFIIKEILITFAQPKLKSSMESAAPNCS